MNTAGAQLAPVLDAGGPRLAELLERTEERLGEVARGHGQALGEHAAGTLAAGGKRLRPLLVFLCAAAGADDAPASDPRVVAAGAAVELLHMATLVHDDVLDAARRCAAAGRPCSRRAAGRRPPRPATCCSRARSPSWRPRAAPRPCARCPRPPRRSPAAS